MADSNTTKGKAAPTSPPPAEGTSTFPSQPPPPQPITNTRPAFFPPRTLFFYGSLMDPEVLSRVARLWQKPKLEDAWVEGFEMKLWNGLYPVLLPVTSGTGSTTTSEASAGNRVRGKAWVATEKDQIEWLQRYETKAYRPVECEVNVGREDKGEGG